MMLFNCRLFFLNLFSSKLVKVSVSRSPNHTTVAVRTSKYTQRATHTYYNSQQLTDRFTHMNTDTCPFVCQHIHTLRRAHKAPSLSVSALPPTAAKIVSSLLSLKQLIKMLWKRSFRSSPDAAFPHWATIYLHKYFTAWHVSASGFIYYWV